jgi:N-acetylmuramic acid 6-phosphate etherase
MVLYEADDFLLDIFGDTTERTPTFSIPPFRRRSDPEDRPNPWAVAYNGERSSAETWRMMLGRDPAGLDWEAHTYRRLGAPEFATAPPRLDATEIAEYPVGRDAGEHYQAHAGLHLSIGFRREAGRFDIAAGDGRRWSLHGVEPASPLDLIAHVAIKLIFNTLSTVTMAKLGRVKGNWMTQVSPTNKKLIDRSIRIVADLLKLSYGDAAERVFGKLAERGADTASLVDEILESR